MLVRGRFPGRDALQAFLLSPIVMPKIVLGVGWFIFFARLGIQGGMLPLILAHTIVVLPFVINIVAANLVGAATAALEEAGPGSRRPLDGPQSGGSCSPRSGRAWS